MTAPVPPVNLDQLERLLAAATPGPWVVDADGDVASAVDPDTWVVVEPTAPDAAAIVAAVNSLPDLIAELRDRRAESEKRLDALIKVRAERDTLRAKVAAALTPVDGRYRCCPHCAEDAIHDVEPDGHDVPCTTCLDGS